MSKIVSITNEFNDLLKTSVKSGIIYSLDELQQTHQGPFLVKKAIEKLYHELGYPQEGAFPSFRIKSESSHVQLLMLSKQQLPEVSKCKYILDSNQHQNLNYPCYSLKLKHKHSESKVVQIPSPFSGEDPISVVLSFQEVIYQAVDVKIKKLLTTPEYVEFCLNEQVKVLTYELTHLLKLELGMTAEKIMPVQHILGLSLKKDYGDLYSAWINHQGILSKSLKKAS